MRFGFIVGISLVLGFMLGWWLKPSPVTPPPPLKASTSAVVPMTAPPVLAPAPEPIVSTPEDRADRIARNAQERRRQYQQAKLAERGAFRLGWRNQGLDPGLADYLDLSPDETARVDAALLAAGHSVQAARVKGAIVSVNPDGSYVIEVPPIDPAASGAEYDRFMKVLQDTIGDDRLALLNDLAGPRLERLFGEFGLDRVRYEIAPEPVIFEGHALLRYQQKRLGAEGYDQASGFSTLTLAQIEKSDPLLFALLPPAIRQKLRP